MLTCVHPFPARMAADIALRRMKRLKKGGVVCDPMAGSGIVLRAAASCKLRGIGFDLDPLAVLMARVWTRPLSIAKFRARATWLLKDAAQLRKDIALPWIDDDEETSQFVDYWFGRQQQRPLRRISYLLRPLRGAVADALRLALSRTIITKDPGAGASLAADVSHSRPHRVLDESDFDVTEGFLRSVERIAQCLEAQPPEGNTNISLGDARCLSKVAEESVDAIITSPPYLNAIDYLRGHRLALVWLGYQLTQLRRIRADSIGAERGADDGTKKEKLLDELITGAVAVERLPPREHNMLARYALDMGAVMEEAHRVLRPGGTATFVIGDCNLRGVYVENSRILKNAAYRAGFQFQSQVSRQIKSARRYLPPPRQSRTGQLDKRLRLETILTFARS